MIAVYHQRRAHEFALMWEPGEGNAPFPKHYELVALVDTNDLEEAWELTNHVDSDWTKGDKVLVDNDGERSSMVGDVFERNGWFGVVDMAGFSNFDDEDGSVLRSCWTSPVARDLKAS